MAALLGKTVTLPEKKKRIPITEEALSRVSEMSMRITLAVSIRLLLVY